MAELDKKRSVISAEKEKIKIRVMTITIYKEQKKRRLERVSFFVKNYMNIIIIKISTY